MSDHSAKAVLILALGVALVVALLFLRPGYLASSASLGVFIGAEILLLAVAKYRKAFFPLLFVTFLWAGAELPMHAAFLQARWIVLAVGAVAGIAVYIKDRAHSFKLLHLMALFCVLSAFVSASTSAYVSEAVLKALSLCLLFMYASAGMRTAVPALNPERFFGVFLLGCEILTWLSAGLYFALRFKLFGNPNSLGAISAVVLVPMLLWGFLTAESRPRRLRLNLELLLAWVLLLSSFSRASIGAATFSSFLVCVSLRQYRLLLKGIAIGIALAACVALLKPLDIDAPPGLGTESITAAYVYKGNQDKGFWGSRQGPWQETWSSIRQKPWFGSGFGTSAVRADMAKLQYRLHHVDTWIIREHGNSYLAILEWTGLLGVLPFYCLVILVLLSAGRVFLWLGRTRNVYCAAVPAAAIVVAGLIDAAFEDWLFAVGYYLCIFFWAMAFILADVAPQEVVVYSPDLSLSAPESYYAVANSR